MTIDERVRKLHENVIKCDEHIRAITGTKKKMGPTSVSLHMGYMSFNDITVYIDTQYIKLEGWSGVTNGTKYLFSSRESIDDALKKAELSVSNFMRSVGLEMKGEYEGCDNCGWDDLPESQRDCDACASGKEHKWKPKEDKQ